MRKIFTFVTALLCAGTMMAADPEVGETIEVEGVKYKLTSSTEVNVIKQDYTAEKLVIPASITYEAKSYNVQEIVVSAFNGNESIKSVDIAAKQVKDGAFCNCKNLETMTIQNGVLELGAQLVEGTKIKTLHIPVSVTSLAYNENYYSALYYNTLESVTIDKDNANFKVGDDGAVYSRDGLKLIGFPYNYEKPYPGIPSGVREVAYRGLFRCQNLADTVTVPFSVQKAKETFYGSNAKCAIVNTNTYDVYSTFCESEQLEEVILGEKCTKIGQLMFKSCPALKKVTVLSETMPVWQYGTNTNWACFSPVATTKVYVHCEQSATFAADANKWGKFTNIIDTLLYDVDVNAANADVVITKLADCNKVNIAVTPNDGYAFVNWDNGETSASFDCTVTCDTTITATMKKILVKNDLFTAKTVEGVSVLYTVLSNAAGDKTVRVGCYTYAMKPAIDKYTTGVVTIPDSAAYFDEKFEVVALDIHAFFECKNITALHLPNTIKKMAGAAIADCFSLTDVNIPTGLIDPGSTNYTYLTSLESITIPSTLKYLGYSWFIGCSELETINGWNPSQFERVGAAGSTSVAKFFTLKQNVDTVGAYIYVGDILYDNVPSYSSSETTIIKEGTRVVSGEAGEQSNSKHVIFPASVEAIGTGALGYEPMLQTCTIKAVTPPLVYCSYDVTAEMTADKLGWSRSSCTNTTTTPDLSTVKFYVPKAAVATYKDNDTWKMLDICPIGGWTVSFRDHNGNNIIDPQNVEQGTAAIRPASVETYYTAEHMYVFAGTWTTTIVNTGDTLYDAVYNEEALPTHYVCFYETEADALAKTNRKYRVEKTHFESAADNALIAATKLTPRECEMVTAWNGGDITNVTDELHVWPTWGTGKYKVIFFDPIGAAAIKTYENKECGDGVDEPAAALIPVYDGKKFTGWDTNAWQYLENMLGDLTVNAVYVDDSGTGLEPYTIHHTPYTNKIIKDNQLLILRG